MNKNFKKVMVTGLTMAMVLGGGTAAFADGKGKGNNNVNNNKGNHKSWDSNKVWDSKKNVWNIKSDNTKDINVNIKLTFDDVKGSDVEWAMRYIASLASKGVFEGYEDGTFQPRRTITRIEAITAAVRLMGLKDEAESAEAKQTNLNFKDADKIKSKYPWAVGYVAVALQNDLFEESDDSVQPEKEADRLWATTLLIKALKLQDEAKTKMNTKLSFKDANKIPAGSVGYVEEAIEKNLIDGYEDNTFRPDRPVTRAELAALLDRTGEQLPDNTSITGAELTSGVSNNTLTLSKDGQTYTIELASNAFIFRNGAKVNASDLQDGDVVTVRTFEGKAYYVEVTTLANGGSQQQDFTGATLSSAVNNNVLTFTKNGQTYSYPLASNVTIVRNGVSNVSASELKSGDIVTVRVSGGKAYFVEVTTAAVDQQRDFTGATLTDEVNNNKLTFSKDGQTYSYPLASNVTIIRNGASNVDESELEDGDIVTVRVSDGKVYFVEVTTAAVDQQRDFTGAALTAAVSNNTLTFTKDGQSYSYPLASNVTIVRNGASNVSASELKNGDIVTVRISGGKAYFIEVTTAAVDQQRDFTGAALTAAVSNNTLTFTKDGQTYSYPLASNVTIVRNGASNVNASELRSGDIVTARVSGGKVYFVEVTTLAEQQTNFTVLGTFNSYTLNSNGKIATISINQTLDNGNVQTAVYNTTTDLTIEGTMSDLTPNRSIELRGWDQVVHTIVIR